MENRDEIFGLLAKLSATQRAPHEHEAMLRSLPDSAKRAFVEMDTGLIREHCKRSLMRKLKDNPGLGQLLDAISVQQIIDQHYINILEDRHKVQTMLGMPKQTRVKARFGRFDGDEYRRVVRR